MANTALLIKECKNGFIVKPGETDANCVISDENYLVFENTATLFEFIQQHFMDSEE